MDDGAAAAEAATLTVKGVRSACLARGLAASWGSPDVPACLPRCERMQEQRESQRRVRGCRGCCWPGRTRWLPPSGPQQHRLLLPRVLGGPCVCVCVRARAGVCVCMGGVGGRVGGRGERRDASGALSQPPTTPPPPHTHTARGRPGCSGSLWVQGRGREGNPAGLFIGRGTAADPALARAARGVGVANAQIQHVNTRAESKECTLKINSNHGTLGQPAVPPVQRAPRGCCGRGCPELLLVSKYTGVACGSRDQGLSTRTRASRPSPSRSPTSEPHGG